jgi:hypothetical protein
MDVLLGNKRPHLEEFDVRMEAVSISLAMSVLRFCTQIIRNSSQMLIKWVLNGIKVLSMFLSLNGYIDRAVL